MFHAVMDYLTAARRISKFILTAHSEVKPTAAWEERDKSKNGRYD